MSSKEVTAEQQCEVINLKRDDYTVYAGRGGGGAKHMLNTDVGERGWLGNPYKLANHSRQESISKFRKAFYEKLQQDSEFREAVQGLAGETLGCYCKPKACHGDVIAKYVNKVAAIKQERA